MELALQYKDQVKLLLDILPVVAKRRCFALKGGTALNLFIWDMPRLSVDIDLVYLPINDREEAFKDIAANLSIIKNCGICKSCRIIFFFSLIETFKKD